MKKLFICIAAIALSCSGLIAQNDSTQLNELTIKLSNEQYKQLEKHFKQKFKNELKETDWARFYRYESQNDTIKKPTKVVFLGNSITDGWFKKRPEFFIANKFVGRGIGGQTTSQMLTRFQADVIDLKPKAVVILAGTNDIARNNGIISHKHILQNIKSMCELAQYHKIKPILCSILPVYQFRWNPKLTPAEDIKKMNEMIKTYAKENGFGYIDYYSAMVDERGGLPVELAEDGVHPTLAGYAIMEPIALEVVRKIVK